MAGFIDIANAWITPSPPVAGQTATLNVSVLNSGTADFAAVTATLSGDGIIMNTCYNYCNSQLAALGSWIPTVTFTVPTTAQTITIATFHQSNPWIQDITLTLSVNPGQAPCTKALLTADKGSVNPGDVVTFTATRIPAASGINATFSYQIAGSGIWTSSGGSSYTDVNGICKNYWNVELANAGKVIYWKVDFPGCYSDGNTLVTVSGGNPGNIVVQSTVCSPNPVLDGNAVTITANLKNDGDSTATETVFLSSDGTNINAQTEILGAHSTGTSVFTRAAGSTGFGVGTHNVCCYTDSTDNKCTSLVVNINTTGPFYSCDSTSNTCAVNPGGKTNTDGCTAALVGQTCPGGATGKCTSSTDCPADSMCLFGSCQKKNTVYIIGGLFFMMMMMQ